MRQCLARRETIIALASQAGLGYDSQPLSLVTLPYLLRSTKKMDNHLPPRDRTSIQLCPFVKLEIGVSCDSEQIKLETLQQFCIIALSASSAIFLLLLRHCLQPLSQFLDLIEPSAWRHFRARAAGTERSCRWQGCCPAVVAISRGCGCQ